MDTVSLTQITSLFILTLIERDDGQKQQILETPTHGCVSRAFAPSLCWLMVLHDPVKMEAIMNILIGLSWKQMGHKFTKLQVLRAAAGFAEDVSMTARSTKKRLDG